AFFTPPGQPADANDPASAPIAPPADPKQAEIAAKAAAEKAKIEADAAHQKMQLEAQLAFEERKFELEKQLKLMDMEIARERHGQDRPRHLAKTWPAAPAGPDGRVAEHPMLAPITALVAELKRANAPKRIARDACGKPVGLEVVQ